MGDTTIAWTDKVWNCLRGCSKVSAGCKNCYAEKMAARFCGPGSPFSGTIGLDRKWTGKIRLAPHKLDEPLRWRKPRRIFVASMSDPFHDGVPDEFLDQVFAVMALADWHSFQLLTKRAERMRSYLTDPATPYRVLRAIDALDVDRAMAGVAEEWRRPVDFSAYEVSNFGNVRRGGRSLVLVPHPRGYRQVGLSVAGKVSTVLVHRLVLQAFDRPAREGEEVAHRNADKADNRLANIRWATKVENMADASRHGTAGVWMKARATLTLGEAEDIRAARRRGEKLITIAARYGATKQQVSAIALGKIFNPPPIEWPLPSVHLYVSASNQETADERIPILLDTPAAVRGVSLEPLLGAVDLTRVAYKGGGGTHLDVLRGLHGVPDLWRGPGKRLDHVIVGGESGPGARPCDVAWVRSTVEQCKAARVPCFAKQLGVLPGISTSEAAACKRKGEPGRWYLRLKHPKGGDPSEWPADLRVQEMPEVRRG